MIGFRVKTKSWNWAVELEGRWGFCDLVTVTLAWNVEEWRIENPLQGSEKYG